MKKPQVTIKDIAKIAGVSFSTVLRSLNNSNEASEKTKGGFNTDNYGSKTRNHIAFLWSDREAGLTDINSIVYAFFFYLGLEYSLEETEDARFIKGRTGDIIHNNISVGIMGEIHPDVLENWGIQTPCACVEIDLDYLS